MKSASQEAVREVAESLLEENCEERALTLVKNPPFANQVYRGKYETSVGEPHSLSRDRVRNTYGMNDVRSDLLWNRLLKYNIDPRMPKTEQVKTIQRLAAKTRVSGRKKDRMRKYGSSQPRALTGTKDLLATSSDIENPASYTDPNIPDEYNDGVLGTV